MKPIKKQIIQYQYVNVDGQVHNDRGHAFNNGEEYFFLYGTSYGSKVHGSHMSWQRDVVIDVMAKYQYVGTQWTRLEYYKDTMFI